MTQAVTVIDYGIGNLLNVLRALEHCGASIRVIDKASPEAAGPTAGAARRRRLR
jgi:glutamine amidotransferase